jgi:molecular chaperone DnaK (HSP70)
MARQSKKRGADWIGCIDFGTALSKFAMVKAVDREDLAPATIRPLAIAQTAGRSGLLLPSIIYVTDEHILFGHEAQNAAIRDEASGRRAFVSPKQYLSTFDLDQIDGLLDKDIDPTGKFTPRKLLQLFLAYLLERAAAEAESQQLPWPVPLRLARPAWKAERAEMGEALLKSLVKEGFALAEALGPALIAPGGLSQRQALAALKKLKLPTAADAELFLLSEEGNASVREATAVASGAIRDNGRRVVVVVDIGGGTSDFGVFATGLAWRNVIAEVEGSSAVLTEAGDHLDMLLRTFILKKAGLSADHPAGAGAARRLLILGRQHKERLFSDGTLTVELGEHNLEITLTEFLAEPQVAAFADRLRERCRHAVEIAVACARDFQRLSRRRTAVSFLFTGGGHDLPMVRALAADPGISWHYDVATPNLAAKAEELDFYSLYPQLAVAIGGAIRELPKETAPVRMEPRAE